MHRRGYIKTVGLTIVAVIVAILICYAAVQPAEGWPAEVRRLVHTGGFSLIQPGGWERHVTFSRDGAADVINFVPTKSVGPPGDLTAMRLSPTTPDEVRSRHYTDTTFQGKPAFERIREYEYTHEHSRSLVFERDGVWFDVNVRRPSAQPLDRGLWGAYVDSFRTEQVRTPPMLISEAHAPTTLPATTSPTTAATP